MTLLDRCTEFLQSNMGDCQPGQALDLRDFVHSEVGRAAHESLEDTAPVVLYLATEKDRDEFITAIHQALPGMIGRKWP